MREKKHWRTGCPGPLACMRLHDGAIVIAKRSWRHRFIYHGMSEAHRVLRSLSVEQHADRLEAASLAVLRRQGVRRVQVPCREVAWFPTLTGVAPIGAYKVPSATNAAGKTDQDLPHWVATYTPAEANASIVARWRSFDAEADRRPARALLGKPPPGMRTGRWRPAFSKTEMAAMTEPGLSSPRVRIRHAWEGSQTGRTVLVSKTFVWSERSRRVYAFDQSTSGKRVLTARSEARRNRQRERMLIALLQSIGETTLRIPDNLVCELPALTGLDKEWLTFAVP